MEEVQNIDSRNATERFIFEEDEWDEDNHLMFGDASSKHFFSKKKLRNRPIAPKVPLQPYEEKLVRNKGGRGVKRLPKKRGANRGMRHLDYQSWLLTMGTN